VLNATHKEVAEHVHFLPVLVLCRQLPSTALERRLFTAADDSTAVACSAVALRGLTATRTDNNNNNYVRITQTKRKIYT